MLTCLAMPECLEFHHGKPLQLKDTNVITNSSMIKSSICLASNILGFLTYRLWQGLSGRTGQSDRIAPRTFLETFFEVVGMVIPTSHQAFESPEQNRPTSFLYNALKSGGLPVPSMIIKTNFKDFNCIK